MGGGASPPEDGRGEQHQQAVAHLYGLCDAAAFPTTGVDYTGLCEDYKQVDQVLNSLQHTKSLVSSFAAHIEIVAQMKQAAQRYQELEQCTQEVVERCDRLAEGLRSMAPLLAAPLEESAPGARRALGVAWSRLQSLGTQLQGTAAAHRAVGQDLERMAARAQAVVRNPSKADLGVAAAPAMGGGAGALAALVLRGVMGPWAIPAGALAGALGVSAFSEHVLHPEAKVAFTRLQSALDLVSGLVNSRASVLDALASDLHEAAGQLMAVTEISPDGSEEVRRMLGEGLAACEASLKSTATRCSSCKYQTTPFLALVEC